MSFLSRLLVSLLILPPMLPGGADVRGTSLPESAATTSPQALTPGQAQPGPSPAILAGENELTVEWWAPPAEARLLADGSAHLDVPGYAYMELPGAPRLPYTTVLVTLPPGAAPTLELRQVSEAEIPLPGPVELAGRPQGVLRSPEGQVIGGAFEPAVEAASFNPQVVLLEKLGILRGAQLARLVFYPARPDGTRLRVATHVQAVLHYNLPGRPKHSQQDLKDPIQAMLRSAVANPQQITSLPQTGALRQGTEAVRSGPGESSDSSSTAVVEVTQAGLTAIAYETLASTGFPIEGIDPQRLRLSRAGVDIPTERQDDGNDVFEPGERLLFYAAPRFSRWTAADVYFLSLADEPGTAMMSRAADPAGLPAASPRIEATAERNIIYTPECYCSPIPAGRDGDRWAWKDLRAPNQTSATFPVELPAVDPSQPGSLTLWLIGYTDVEAAPDHHIDVKLNGISLGSVEWDGKQAVQTSLPVPASALLDGANTLELSLAGISGVSVEGAWLDAFSIQYRRSGVAAGENLLFEGDETAHAYTLSLGSGGQDASELRAYDVTDPDRPQQLTGTTAGAANSISLGDPPGGGSRQYWITTEGGILSPTRVRMVSTLQTASTSGADYILITPPEFQPALNDLKALRESQGLTVAVEHVQALYDAFGDGRPDPTAIRAFLAHTYQTWSPRPTYVLLVGDGTADPRQYSTSSSSTFIPPYLAEVDPWAGETAADNRFVTLEGDDNLPEMLIGRLPVNSLAEAQAVITKILQYETNAAAGPWSQMAFFVSDNPDGGGNFYGASEAVVEAVIAPPETPVRLYYEPSDPPVSPDPAAAVFHQDLLKSWNLGAGLLTFTGHASIHQWAVERFIHLDDVSSLSNGGRLPVVLEMTCFTGSFQVPGYPTLDEALLRHPQGGAVAVLGPTGLGITTGHESLATGFIGALLQGDGDSLGAAALRGKLKLAAEHPEFLDLIDTYTLLGDPATHFSRSNQGNTIFLPQVLYK